jgi:hypothetical protein
MAHGCQTKFGLESRRVFELAGKRGGILLIASRKQRYSCNRADTADSCQRAARVPPSKQSSLNSERIAELPNSRNSAICSQPSPRRYHRQSPREGKTELRALHEPPHPNNPHVAAFSPSFCLCSPLSRLLLPPPLPPFRAAPQLSPPPTLIRIVLSQSSISMSTTTALPDSTAAILRPARPPRAPAHTGRYRLSSLANLPSRITKPGELIERELEQRPQLYGNATAMQGEPVFGDFAVLQLTSLDSLQCAVVM